MENKTFVLEHMKAIGLQAAKVLQEQAPDLTGTQIIDRETDVPEFDPAVQYLNWKVGSVVRDEDQVWKLLQPYDSTIYTDKPVNLRAQWGLCHTKNPKKAKPYVEPQGTSGMYMKDECCLENDTVYVSTIDNNVWHPESYPAGWSKYVEITSAG